LPQLKDREIVILEPVVEMGLRQHNKKSRQRQAAQEIAGWNDDRDRTGVGIDQQDECAERIACDLHREDLTTLADTASQQLRSQPADESVPSVSALTLKR
jgi:hypothetical protein